MKNILVAGFLVLSSSSYACSFSTNDAPNVREVVRQRNGYPVSDEVCDFLNRRGLALNVSGKATVLAGVSVAWAEISLTKNGTGVVSDTMRNSTQVNASVASQDKADDMLYIAIKEAVQGFQFQKAANEVQAYLAKRK